MIDFSDEQVVNFEQKCLCVLVLDISGNMRGKPIEMLNKSLNAFYNEICQNDIVSQKIEIALISSNDTVQLLQMPSLVENFTMPTLEARGSTTIAQAMMLAIDLIERRKKWYKLQGIPYYSPSIALITNGEANIKNNIQILCEIESDINIKLLKPDELSSYFVWLHHHITFDPELPYIANKIKK
ncbi:MAG: hypothetical protein IKV77_12080 [Alistipes sp.]|nr:hypothetical protein [Alistipes sp.]